jgi:hypothetical protein
VVEPTASRLAGLAVECGHVGLEIDDGGPVEEINPGEADRCPPDGDQPHQAQAERVDPPRSARGEDADLAGLATEQERYLAKRYRCRGCVRPAQPGEEPRIVEASQPVETVDVRLVEVNGTELVPVEGGLDRRVGGIGPGGPDHTDDSDAFGRVGHEPTLPDGGLPNPSSTV